MSLEIPTAYDLAREREWRTFKEGLHELTMDEAACEDCRALRIEHETTNNEPVCKAHARWRRDLCFYGWTT